MNAAGLPTLYRDYCSAFATLNDIQNVTMKLGGFLLLLSGWAIVVTALAILHGQAVPVFVYAGSAVEILGLVVVVRGHLPPSEDEE